MMSSGRRAFLLLLTAHALMQLEVSDEADVAPPSGQPAFVELGDGARPSLRKLALGALALGAPHAAGAFKVPQVHSPAHGRPLPHTYQSPVQMQMHPGPNFLIDRDEEPDKWSQYSVWDEEYGHYVPVDEKVYAQLLKAEERQDQIDQKAAVRKAIVAARLAAKEERQAERAEKRAVRAEKRAERALARAEKKGATKGRRAAINWRKLGRKRKLQAKKRRLMAEGEAVIARREDIQAELKEKLARRQHYVGPTDADGSEGHFD